MTTSESPAEYPQVRFRPPAGATELLLIRHGESAPARPGRPFPLVDGQGDPGLSPAGRQQAERVAERLAGEHFDAVYATTLRRTAQTAAPLAARLGLAVRVEGGLREVHLGDWEGGLYRQMVAERHPTAVRMWTEQRWDVIPGAEPAADFAARVRTAATRLAAAHPGQRLAAFTHGGTIAELLSQATGSRPFAFRGADNASLTLLVLTPTHWILRSFNDTAHLGPPFPSHPSPPT